MFWNFTRNCTGTSPLVLLAEVGHNEFGPLRSIFVSLSNVVTQHCQWLVGNICFLIFICWFLCLFIALYLLFTTTYNSAVIYANRHVLSLFERTHPHRLARMTVPSSTGLQYLTGSTRLPTLGMNGDCVVENIGPIIIGHVFIHPTASIDRTAVVSDRSCVCPCLHAASLRPFTIVTRACPE